MRVPPPWGHNNLKHSSTQGTTYRPADTASKLTCASSSSQIILYTRVYRKVTYAPKHQNQICAANFSCIKQLKYTNLHVFLKNRFKAFSSSMQHNLYIFLINYDKFSISKWVTYANKMRLLRRSKSALVYIISYLSTKEWRVKVHIFKALLFDPYAPIARRSSHRSISYAQISYSRSNWPPPF